MKVLHVCETVKGGIATYLNELLPLITDAKNDVTCCTILPDVHANELREIEGNVAVYFKRKSRLLGLLFLGFASLRTILSFKPDVVHIHSTFAGVIVRPICFILRKPVVYCPHGWATDMEQSRIKKSLIRLIEKLLSFVTFKIVAISNWEREQAIEMGLKPEKVVTVYNGISDSPPSITPVKWGDTRIKLLFVGRFDRQKGLDVLLEAISGCTNTISLRVIGEAVNDQGALTTGNSSNVEYLGWKKTEEVSAYMEAADAIVVPSRWEGFGLVAVEAMRVSKPVIASKVGGLSEVVAHNKTGFHVIPNDMNSLKVRLESLDVKKLSSFGVAGRQRFIAKFTSDKMAEQIIALYKEAYKGQG